MFVSRPQVQVPLNLAGNLQFAPRSTNNCHHRHQDCHEDQYSEQFDENDFYCLGFYSYNVLLKMLDKLGMRLRESKGEMVEA